MAPVPPPSARPLPRADARSGAWFLAVGALAAGVHYVVAVALAAVGLPPAGANVGGFVSAFPASYLGHRYLTFQGTTAPHRSALPRLLAVSVTAFAANQLLLLALLRYSGLPLWLALPPVLAAVAAATYLLGRRWAFAR